MARRNRRPRSTTTWRDAAHHTRNRNAPTAGQTALTAIRGYGRWVAHSPDTRGLGNALAALYPLGEIGHLTGADPLMLGAFAPPAALAAWVGTYKKHASPRYSATVAATAAGIPAWLGTAAHLGILNLPTLLAYSISATVTWSAYTWSDVLKKRRAWAREQLKWDELATAAGLEDSRLIGIDDTRLGVRFRVDVRATNKRASQLAGKGGGLAEDIAAQIGLPAERVRITTDDKHAGIILVLVQMLDPWAEPATHPALDPAAAPTLAAARRSVLDGPFVIGIDPDTGNPMTLTVFDRAGGHHVFVVASTGSGKTTLYNNVIEQATACIDVLVWGIDLGKGTIARFWGPALDAAAGIGEEKKALQILEWACLTIDHRSRETGGRNHQPTPTDPVILIPVDELDTLTGANSSIALKAKPMIEHIYRRGRSAGVELLTASQRGVVQYTGSKDPHANADNKVVLRMNRAAEMGNVVPEWEASGMPNMASYARGVKGVALVVDSENTWVAGRVLDLSDLDAVERLAHQRGAPTATLPAALAKQLPGYADRHRVHATSTAGGGTGPAASSFPPPPPAPPLPGDDRSELDAAPGGAEPTAGGASGKRGSRIGHGWQAGFGIDPDDHDAVERLAGELVSEVEARLRDMPKPPKQPTSLADMIKAKEVLDNAENNPPEVNQNIPVSEKIAGPVLALLAERGADGATPAELTKAVGKGESTVRRYLAIMRDHKPPLIVGSGSTRNLRYYLPDHAPGADPTTDHDQ
ncbi:hypothetical protein [Actinomadura verrucosospora]|uniref:FtsK domain-containing protein n=1 Tax=Actinomadura verrucosospora TaxID=46165 RepID=A0A7D4ACL4_ACTVE|nr:hypothetical protein [Actinomadura verrucosospora]QKG27307.1 hypothetical protein ACTIVE_8962 [Actinomadura verrucosospora]